jgi:hypothetical protein
MATENETTFEDADSYNPNYNVDKITFRDIILQHLRKITTLACVEMRGGHYESKSSNKKNSNEIIKTWIPDTRIIYINAVDCFADMLYPYFDKEMLEAENNSVTELKKVFNELTIESNQGSINTRIFISGVEKNMYQMEHLRISKKLFRELCSFLYRKRYLELGTIED